MQAPLTAFIIVMEMIDGHAMVLSLLAMAMLGSLVSRMICLTWSGALVACPHRFMGHLLGN